MAKDRVILYTLRVVNDPTNAKAAAEQIRLFRETEAAAKAATKAMNEVRNAQAGVMNATRGGGRGGSGSGGGRSSFARGMSAGAQSLAEERREREANLRERIRGHETEERAAVKAVATIKRHNNELNAGLKQTVSGIGSVARAFVLLGISGEENIEKAVRAFAKFEAGMQGIQGAANIVGGGAKAFRAYRGLSAGSGLAAGVGAIGAGSTVLAGGAALAVGGGIGFGIGRAAIGGASFGRMTDAWGMTDYAGEHRQRAASRNAARAGQWNVQRNSTDFRYAQYNQQAAIDLDYAQGTGGMSAAANQAYQNADRASQRAREVNANITANPGMAREVATREQANATASQIQAMSTVISLDQQRLAIVRQAVSEEKARTQAIKDQQQAIKAAVGMADADMIKLAESAAGKRRRGEITTPQEAAALGAIIPEFGQQEAAKIGESVFNKYPELKALAEQMRLANEKASKDISVKVQSEVTGKIVLTPDLEQTKQNFEAILTKWFEQNRDLMNEQLERDRADRDSQQQLARQTSGT